MANNIYKNNKPFSKADYLCDSKAIEATEKLFEEHELYFHAHQNGENKQVDGFVWQDIEAYERGDNPLFAIELETKLIWDATDGNDENHYNFGFPDVSFEAKKTKYDMCPYPNKKECKVMVPGIWLLWDSTYSACVVLDISIVREKGKEGRKMCRNSFLDTFFYVQFEDCHLGTEGAVDAMVKIWEAYMLEDFYMQQAVEASSEYEFMENCSCFY